MDKIGISLFLVLTLTGKAFSQNSLDDLNVYFKHDFEQNTLGMYLESEWGKDWLYPPFSSGRIPPEITRDTKNPENPTKVMQWNFPEGSLGPTEGGGQWESSLGTSYNEIYFSYDVLFMPGFEFALGGKLPGLKGGVIGDGKPEWDQGFTATMMFREEGRLVFYTFNQNQALEVGDSWSWQVYVTPGKWHNITIRVVMNTIGPDGGNDDGILEGFFDGKLVCSLSNMHFRNIESIATDAMKIYSHFGGGSDEWRNPIDEFIRVDNFILFTFKDHMNVPRGNTPSPVNRTINYWRQFSYKEVNSQSNTNGPTLTLYPNPTTGKVNIMVEKVQIPEYIDNEEPGQQIGDKRPYISIIDISGKILFSKLIYFYEPYFKETFDLSGVKNGLYFVVLNISNKIVKSKLLLNR